MSTTLIALGLFFILALVLFSIALLYKSKTEGEISIFGWKIHLKTSGGPSQKPKTNSRRPDTSSEVNIQADMKDVRIEKVAGRDIDNSEDNGGKSQSNNSKVVIRGQLRNTDVNQIAGRDIEDRSPKSRSSKRRSNLPKGKSK